MQLKVFLFDKCLFKFREKGNDCQHKVVGESTNSICKDIFM